MKVMSDSSVPSTSLLFLFTVQYGMAAAAVAVVEVLGAGEEVEKSTPLLPCNSTSSSGAQDVFVCYPGVCVSLGLRCNGVPDCPDGADEAVVECGCLPNEYQCGVTCIDLGRRCDTRPDCPGGEDEQDCETHECPVTHFKCENHLCVPSELVCDFDDHCGDGSDEHQCHHRKCWKAEFECDNGQCIRPGRVCDGDLHCKDGSDERHCLPGDFAVCGSGSRVHRYYWCDGWPHCSDNHADELNCGECGGPGREYRCPNTRCLPAANECDAVCDCLPGCEDEAACSEHPNATYLITDGVKRCQVGEALGCHVPNGDRRLDRCISESHICDGHNDCHNGGYLSDEYGCETSPCPGEGGPAESGVSWFRCTDGRCLPPHLQCDHNPDCLHGEDEANCSIPAACQDGEWRCESGQCIPDSARCDLAFQCLDKSDEIACGEGLCTVTQDRIPPLKTPAGGLAVKSQDKADLLATHFSSKMTVEEPDRQPPLLPRLGNFVLENLEITEGTVAKHLRDTNTRKAPAFSCSSSAPQCECRDISIKCQRLGLTRLPRDIEPQISRSLLWLTD
ncbi:G-protein coupled receptor GRL101-like [Eriocheir sinensis]|uniref:G-protein coupled receptor GRL101-like n=1 Tax=Eriocheir sinensis TaxID=95602 RepID=UPI0021C5FF46|nr:G-protein coupled receptor GRL101-like [Eriocheir sinensis]